MNDQDLFIDGVLNVTLVKGLIRLDVYSLSATDYRDGQPQPEFRRRLVMNPQTLVAVHQDIWAAITALRERGVIPMSPAGGGPQVSAPLASQAAPPRGPVPDAAPADPGAPDAPAAPEVPTNLLPDSPAPPPAAPPLQPRVPRSRNFPTTMGT